MDLLSCRKMARKLSERSLRERDEADAEYKLFPVPMHSAARMATINDLRIPSSCRLFKQVIHGDGTHQRALRSPAWRRSLGDGSEKLVTALAV